MTLRNWMIWFAALMGAMLIVAGCVPPPRSQMTPMERDQLAKEYGYKNSNLTIHDGQQRVTASGGTAKADKEPRPFGPLGFAQTQITDTTTQIGSSTGKVVSGKPRELTWKGAAQSYSGGTTVGGGTMPSSGRRDREYTRLIVEPDDKSVASKNKNEREEIWIVPKKPRNATDGNTNFDPKDASDSILLPTTEPSAARAGDGDRDAERSAKTQVKPLDENLPLTDIPGTGGLVMRDPKTQKNVAVPLKHTSVSANVSSYIASVDVTQQYQNPFSEKIEAVYVFPLPENAAVSDFVMTIGDRKIRGIVRERAEAEKIYAEAKNQGFVASLLTEERPNIFTQKVANIEPGKQIDISIRYFNSLSYSDGWFEFVFPMVVGPRFNPPGSTQGVGAAPVGGAGTTGQKTEVQYLRPAERSGHDIALKLHIDAGMKIEEIDSRNHKIESSGDNNGCADISLSQSDSIPNKDFVLRYRLGADQVKSGLIVHRDARGGFFTLMMVPPISLKEIPRQPLEMVFTLDVSGSMSGTPFEQSRAAVQYALQHMRPDDTFQIIRFAGSTDCMSPAPLPATPENIAKAQGFLQQTDAGGGTMMLEGIRASLNFQHDPRRLRFISFLTDGYIGNETEILREIRKCRGNSRLFSFGVGSSVNRYLLDGIARFGRGTVAYLGLNDDASKVMSAYFERISHPAMGDVSVDFGSMKTSDVFPARIPDLYVGQPVIITGRFEGAGPTTINIHGMAGGVKQSIAVPVNLEKSQNHDGLAQVWARQKISDLEDSAIEQTDSNFPTLVKQTALEYGLLSPYTAFVAVDSTLLTTGDHGTTVAVPVPVPDGVRYDTTVPEK